MTVACLTGNAFYIVPIKVCTVIGSVLMGVAYVQSAVFNSEILRVYPADEVQVKYSLTLVTYGVGDSIGPICAKMMENIKFNVAGMEIMYGNSISLVLISFSVVRLILTWFFVHDLSKEFDLKAVQQEENTKQNKEIFYWGKMKKIVSMDMVLLFFHQWYSGFWTLLLPRMLPLITESVNLSKTVLGVCYVISGVVMTGMAFIMIKIGSSTEKVYHFGLMNISVMFLVQIVIFIIRLQVSYVVSVILVIVIAVSYGVIWITEMTYIVITLGKLTPSSSQTSVEGTKESVRLFAALLSSFAAAYIYENYTYFLPVSIFLLVLIAMATSLRQRSLRDPKFNTYFCIKESTSESSEEDYSDD